MKSAPAATFLAILTSLRPHLLRERVRGAPEEHSGGRLDLVTVHEAPVAHPVRDGDELDRVEVEPGRASGWFPMTMWSPVSRSRFLTPRADAPRMSLWSARRFLSRQVIWTIGSTPSSSRSPRSRWTTPHDAGLVVGRVDGIDDVAEVGGLLPHGVGRGSERRPSSPVTMNRPAPMASLSVRARCESPLEGRSRPAAGGSPLTVSRFLSRARPPPRRSSVGDGRTRHVGPSRSRGRRSARPSVARGPIGAGAICAGASRRVRAYLSAVDAVPDAAALRIDLTEPARPRSAARAVPQSLGAPLRATKAVRHRTHSPHR